MRTDCRSRRECLIEFYKMCVKVLVDLRRNSLLVKVLDLVYNPCRSSTGTCVGCAVAVGRGVVFQPQASRVGSWLVPFSASHRPPITKNRHIKIFMCVPSSSIALNFSLARKLLTVPIESKLLIASQSTSILLTGVEQSWGFYVSKLAQVVSRGEPPEISSGRWREKKARG